MRAGDVNEKPKRKKMRRGKKEAKEKGGHKKTICELFVLYISIMYKNKGGMIKETRRCMEGREVGRIERCRGKSLARRGGKRQMADRRAKDRQR